MPKPVITVIGLGLTGSSIGLALQRSETGFEIVGHDRDPEAAQAARKQNAVARVEWNLHRAVENAGLVILALPLGEVEETATHLTEDLQPGVMLLALGSLLQPLLTAAEAHVPAHAHFVAGHPVLPNAGGVQTPSAGLFTGATFALAPGLRTDPSAVQLASDFVERIGAQPFFVDPLEHDGIMAGVEQLPQVVAAGLMQLSAGSPGWREARRLAGRAFAQSTEFGHSAPQLHAALRANRELVLLRLRQLQQELAAWAAVIEAQPAEGEADPLLANLEAVVDARAAWAEQVARHNWEELPASGAKKVEGSGMLRQMLFGNLGRRANDANNR